MTLSTSIYVKDPVPAEALFRFAQSLLAPPEREQVWSHRNPGEYSVARLAWDPEPKSPANPNGEWSNHLGQGLPAILEVFYGADGPLIVDDYGSEDPDYFLHHSGCLEVRLDTAYGYNVNGAGCEDLHAWIVQEIGRWLEDRGAKYEWDNEFTAEWFSSVDDMSPLGDPERGRLPHWTASS